MKQEEEPPAETEKESVPRASRSRRSQTVRGVVKKRKTPPSNAAEVDTHRPGTADKKPKLETDVQAKRPAPARAKIAEEEENISGIESDQEGKRGRNKRKTKNEVVKAPTLAKPSLEMEFAMHVAHLESPLLTFESTVRALLKTLNHGSDLHLPQNSMSSCAECRGGGDLLCCDCCHFAFHLECLEPLERGSYLYVPVRKYGLREERGSSNESLKLSETEWFCPYCLAPPIQRYWKRGVPQFMKTFKGFPPRVTEAHTNKQTSGVLSTWCKSVENFADENMAKQDHFPPNVLLAMAGIRRAIQRLGPTFQQETRAEIETIQKAAIAEPPLTELPDDEIAEPDIKEEHVGAKPPIVQTQDITKFSDEGTANSDTEKAKPKTARSRAARAAIVPTTDETDAFGTARMNVGPGYQVPAYHKYMVEATELGCHYSALDRHSVYAYLPRDEDGLIPDHFIPSKGTCRLVYSATELRKYQNKILNCSDADAESIRLNTTIPLADDELNLYIRQSIMLWPAWIQWPPTQEYALKVLHHCRYDAKSALTLLCSDGMQFRPICDPPVRPYNNKWRPRDKRGHIPRIPYPPPSLPLSLAGVDGPPI